MACSVEYADEFGDWWKTLSDGEQADVAAYVTLLEERDVRLGFPHSSAIRGSRLTICGSFARQAVAGLAMPSIRRPDWRSCSSAEHATGDDRFYERVH